MSTKSALPTALSLFTDAVRSLGSTPHQLSWPPLKLFEWTPLQWKHVFRTVNRRKLIDLIDLIDIPGYLVWFSHPIMNKCGRWRARRASSLRFVSPFPPSKKTIRPLIAPFFMIRIIFYDSRGFEERRVAIYNNVLLCLTSLCKEHGLNV